MASSSVEGSAMSTHTLAPGSSIRSLTREGSNASSLSTPSLYSRHVIMAGQRSARAAVEYAAGVSALDALARLFACRDWLLERHEQTPWGAVVSDPRFPLIHDANYARVDRDREDLTAEVVERALVPALRASGGRQLHVVMLDPVATSKLLGSFEAEGGETVRATLMPHA